MAAAAADAAPDAAPDAGVFVEKKFEQFVVDTDFIGGFECGWVEEKEIHQCDWKPVQPHNNARINTGLDFIYVNLGTGGGGSAPKLHLHNTLVFAGKEYRLYMHHNQLYPGVIVREIDAGTRVITIKPRLVYKQRIKVEVISALTGSDVIPPLTFPAAEKIRASTVINKIRSELVKRGSSRYMPIQIMFVDGQTPIRSQTLIWSPGMHAPVGAVDAAGNRRKAPASSSSSSSKSRRK